MVAALNQEKALVGAFSVIVKSSPKVRCELYWGDEMRSYLLLAATDCGQLGAADRMLTRSWDGDRGNLDQIQYQVYLGGIETPIELSLSNCAWKCLVDVTVYSTVMRFFSLYDDLYDEYEPSPATSTVVTRLKRIHHPGYCWVIVTKYHIFAQIPQIGYPALTQPNTATFLSTSSTMYI